MKKTKVFLFYFVSIFMTILLVCSFVLIDNTTTEIPSAIGEHKRIINQPSKGDTIGNFLKFADYYYLSGFSFSCELQHTKLKNQDIIPVLIDENFFTVNQKKCSNQEGITSDMIKAGEKSAVISDSLALKLFLNSNDAINKKITFNNEQYTVCATYKESDNIVSQASKDKYERIYIPYTSVKDYEKTTIDTFIYETNTRTQSIMVQRGNEAYTKITYTDKNKLITNFSIMLFLLLFAALCVALLKALRALFKNLVQFFKSELEQNYFRSIIRKHPLRIFLQSIAILIIPVIIAAPFFIFGVNIYVVSKYIPDDNIFDIPHYINAFISACQQRNFIQSSGNHYIENLYSNTFNSLLILLGIFTVTYIAWLKLNNHVFKKSRLHCYLMIIFCAIGAILPLILYYITGISSLLLISVAMAIIAVTVLINMIYNKSKAKLY